MLDYIIIDQDQVIFLPFFGAAVVGVKPGSISASGPATLAGDKVCLDGDEKDVEVPGCLYLTPKFLVTGVGTLKIQTLLKNQIATKTQSGGTKVLLKGTFFTAVFEVQTPAQIPPPISSPDPSPQYPGLGMFVTANSKFRGT